MDGSGEENPKDCKNNLIKLLSAILALKMTQATKYLDLYSF